MASNQIIQSLWIGESLTNNEILCIKSYLKNGHDFHLYTYNEIHNLPKGLTQLDANEILDSSLIFKDSYKGYASFSDWFRFKMLFQLGGWWVDMDAICIQYFDIKEQYCFSTEKDRENKRKVNIGAIKSPAGAEYLKECLDYIEEEKSLCDEDNIVVPWGSFGPALFENVLKSYDSESFIKHPDVFCPIDYFNIESLINSSGYTLKEETLSIHLWNEVWNRESLDKNASYAKDSIYEWMKTKYL